jgi:hypothetical protein
MFQPKYIFLTFSLIALAVGFSDARPAVFFYLGRPVGAILFGLFLIAQVLEKESALYDEQKRAPEPTRKTGEIRKQPLSIQKEMAHDPALTTAHSH